MACTASASLPAPFARALRTCPEIDLVDLTERRAERFDGIVGEIELMFDLDGDATTDPFLAESFIVRWPDATWSSEESENFHLSGHR